MYAGFFGLQQTPFSIAPDPHYLFMSERHREALAHLLYGVQGGGGFVLLTGEIGAGKTTVCRCFLEQIPENCRVAYIFNPKLTVGDLLKTVCHEFQLEVKHEGIGPATIKDHVDALNEYLLRSHAAGQRNVLIIDEAQNLTPHVLEQLRLLTNLETSERKLLQIVLIGQPELRAVLARPELEQLAQRVIARFHLGTLSEAETGQYVRHRMEVAGHSGPLPFSDQAIARIQAITKGVPRRINLLCDRALLGAYATDSRRIGRRMVDKAASEVFDLPPPPRETTPTVGQVMVQKPWLALGLGAMGGAVLAGLIALVLWPQPMPAVPASTDNTAARAPAAAGPAPDLAAPLASEPVPSGSTPTGTVTSSGAALAGGNQIALATLPAPRAGMPAASDLWRSDSNAWRELAPLWGLQLGAGDACTLALQNRLQCFNTPRMTLHGLRQLNRPGILNLQLPGEGPRRALLTAMASDSVTLQADGQRWELPLTALAGIWQGGYSTLWRQPEGVQGRIGTGAKGVAEAWLDQRLSELQSKGLLVTSADSFTGRLSAFQQAQGITANGQATPMTFMQVNLVSGVDEPRLSAP
jgi:general secretion pathway protein A